MIMDIDTGQSLPHGHTSALSCMLLHGPWTDFRLSCLHERSDSLMTRTTYPGTICQDIAALA